LPWASLRPYDSEVRFTCSRCGKRYASTDEPVSGRIYAIGCRCGHTIVVKGPEEVVGARDGPAAPVPEDPFYAFHRERKRSPAQASAPAPEASRPRPAPAAPPAADPDVDSLWAWNAEPPPAPAEPPLAPAEPPPFPAPVEPLPFDGLAAGPGLLDVDRAEALSSGSMATEASPLPPPQDDDEVSVTFSDKFPLPLGGARRPWLLAAAIGLAVLVVAGGAVAVLSRRPRGLPPEMEAPAAPPAEAPAAGVPQVPAPQAPPPQLPAAPGALPAQPSDSPRALSPSRPPRPARRTPAPPGVTSEPIPPASADAVSPALLDLMSRKADAPASPPKPESRGGVSPGPSEVQAAVERDRSAFDACLSAPGTEEPPGGRKLVLSLIVNPSGIVTSPHLDDADLEGSPAGACLMAAARKLVLPSFAGDAVRLRVPLSLGP